MASLAASSPSSGLLSHSSSRKYRSFGGNSDLAESYDALSLRGAQDQLRMRGMLRRAFRQTDHNNDGLVTRGELASAVASESFLREVSASAIKARSAIEHSLLNSDDAVPDGGIRADWAEAELHCEDFVEIVLEALTACQGADCRVDVDVDASSASAVAVTEDYTNALSTLKSTAEEHFRAGRGDLALEFWGSALGLQRQEVGAGHPDCADTLICLGDAARRTGDYNTAVDMYQRALMIRLSLFGRTHTEVASVLCDVAEAYRALGILHEAVQHYRMALALFQSLPGNRSPDVAAVYNNVGIVFAAQGRPIDAYECLSRSLLLCIDTFGECHEDTADVWSNIAATLADSERLGPALTAYRHTVNIRQDVLGDTHPDVGSSFVGMAVVSERLGDRQTAIALHSKVFETQGRNGNAFQVPIADAMFNIALAYDAEGLRGKARAHMDAAFRAYRSEYGAGHAAACAAKRWLSELYSTKRQSAAAVRPLTPAQSSLLPSPQASSGSLDDFINEVPWSLPSAGEEKRRLTEEVLKKMMDADVLLDVSTQLESARRCPDVVLWLRKRALQSALRQYNFLSLDITKFYLALGKAHLTIARLSAMQNRMSRALVMYAAAAKYFVKTAALEGEVYMIMSERILTAYILGAYATLEFGECCAASELFKLQERALRLYAQAHDSFKRAESFLWKLPEPSLTVLADIKHGITHTSRRLRLYGQPPDEAKRALEIRERYYGTMNSKTLEAAESLARSYLVRIPLFGEPHLAREAVEALIEARRKVNDQAAGPETQLGSQSVEAESHLLSGVGTSPTEALIAALELCVDILLEEGKHLESYKLPGNPEASYLQALDKCREAQAILMRHFGRGHARAMGVQLRMAMTYSMLGREIDAEACFTGALSERIHAVGENHRHVAEVFHWMGAHYHRCKQFRRSIEHYEHALEIRKLVLFNEHLDIACTFEGIAECCQCLRNTNATIGYMQQALTRRMATLGGHVLDLLAPWSACAKCYDVRGNYADAVKFQIKVIALLTANGSEESPVGQRALVNGAYMFWGLGRLREARDMAESAADIAAKVFGQDGAVHADRRFDLARMNLVLGEAEPDTDRLIECADVLATSRGKLHFSAMDAKRWVYDTLVAKGELGDAHSFTVPNLSDTGGFQSPCFYYTRFRTLIADCYTQHGPHSIAAEFYDTACAELGQILGELHPEVGRLASKLGTAMLEQHDAAAAKKHLKKALDIGELAYEPSHPDYPDLIPVHIALGDSENANGHPTLALECYEKVLKMILVTYGEYHSLTADVLVKRARTQRTLRNYHNATCYLERAAKIRIALYGEADSRVVDISDELAQTYFSSSSRLEKAGKLLEDVLRQRAQLDGRYAASVETTHRRLAELFVAMGDGEHANEHLQKARAIARVRGDVASAGGSNGPASTYEGMIDELETEHGDRHPHVARVHLCIADTLLAKGEREDALEHYGRAVRILAAQEPPDGEEIAAAYVKIGGVYLEKEDNVSALESFEMALSYRQDTDDLQSAELLEQVARLKLRYRHTKEAIELYRKVIKLKTRFLSNSHPSLAVLWADLGDAQARSGNAESALTCFRKAVEIVTKGKVPADIAGAIITRACGVFDLGGDEAMKAAEVEKALRHYEKSLSLRLQYFSPDHKTIAPLRRRIGVACSRLGQMDKAMKNFLACLTFRYDETGDDDKGFNVQAAYYELGEHYARWADYELGYRYLTKALTLNRERLGVRRPDNLTAIVSIAACCAKMLKIRRTSLSGLRHMYITACYWRSCEAYDCAFKTFTEVLAISDKIHASPDFAAAVSDNLAALYSLKPSSSREDAIEALAHFCKAHERLCVLFGKDDELAVEEETWLQEFEAIVTGQAPAKMIEGKFVKEAQKAYNALMKEDESEETVKPSTPEHPENRLARPPPQKPEKRPEIDQRVATHLRQVLMSRSREVLGRPFCDVFKVTNKGETDKIWACELEELVRQTLGVDRNIVTEWHFDALLDHIDPKRTDQLSRTSLASFFGCFGGFSQPQGRSPDRADRRPGKGVRRTGGQFLRRAPAMNVVVK